MALTHAGRGGASGSRVAFCAQDRSRLAARARDTGRTACRSRPLRFRSSVVAEGVETRDQLAFLAREACDHVQGYLMGRPAPIAAYAQIVGRPVPPQAMPAQAG